MALTNKIKSTASGFASGYFGMVLGLIGTGMAWRYAAAEQGFPAVIGEVIIAAGMMVWLVLMLLFILKCICFPGSVTAEFRHPVAGGFSSLLPATTVLTAMGLAPYLPVTAVVLFVPGAAAQLSYAAWLTGAQWKGVFPETATTPVLYLPTVANNFICAMACGAFGFTDLGTLFFGAGVFSWLSLEPAILKRIRSSGLMDEKARLSFGIQLAPALVACSAYLAVNHNHIDFFAKMLLGYGLLQLIFMIRLIPWFTQQAFSLSFWSFSFGASALAKASLNLSMNSDSEFMHLLAFALFIFANAFILLLVINSLWLLVRKQVRRVRIHG